MTDPSHDRKAESEPRVSPELAEDLGALFDAAGLRVPATIDQRILNRARARIAGQASRRRPLRPWWAGAAAATAAAALLAAVVWLDVVQPRRQQQIVTSVPADIDGNGQVDILDALVLARRVDAQAPGARDVNEDGAVDRDDVDAVAMLAVSLRRGGAQ